MNFPSSEFDDAVAAACHGSADDALLRALSQLLKENAAARDEYLLRVALHVRLATHLPIVTTHIIGRVPRQLWRRPAAIAASVAMLALATWAFFETRAPFATVTASVGSEFHSGRTVRGDDFNLAEGSVEFITATGARVVVEAPAAFQFQSAQRLGVTHGKVSADVPPSAKGFTVLTPDGNAVDLGTKFGVDVPPVGAAEIHVFQGKVIAQATGANSKQSLHGGEALTMASGIGAARELRSAAFIQSDEMQSLTAGLAAGQRARADAALSILRKDPALIALFDFNAQLPEGVFRAAQGRWPGSHALEFVSRGDHLKLDVGGDRAWPKLTLAAWVRLDRLEAPYQSLYHTDGWQQDKPGQVHWIVLHDGTMRLALRQNTMSKETPAPGGYPNSRTPVLPPLPERGRWVHLAVVYNSDARTVRFYLNGAFDNEIVQQVALPARLGPAQIGNWNKEDRKLSGRMDEFIILGRALTDDEMRALYTAENPYHL